VLDWHALLPSLHYDFSCHLRVDRTAVVVRTWFCEGKREMVIRMESVRFEHLIAGYYMGDIVVVRPCDRGPGSNGDVFRVKAAVVDLDSGTTCGFVTRPGSCGQRKGCHHYRRQSEYPLDSFHSGTIPTNSKGGQPTQVTVATFHNVENQHVAGLECDFVRLGTASASYR
jgi:hypothetical protein